MRSVSPTKAENWVKHSRARWVHAPEVEPNKQRGTIILTHPVAEQPAERFETQIYNGDGELLGYLHMEMAGLYIRKGQIAQVGTATEDGPRAAILPHTVDSVAMEAIRRIEGWRISEGLKARAAVRREIEKEMSTLSGEKLESKILESVLQRLGKDEAELALSDLRGMRRRIVAMEMALAPDLADIRRLLILKRWQL
jgi:hypothetical protein